MKRLCMLVLLMLCACTATQQDKTVWNPDPSPEAGRRIQALILANGMPHTPVLMRHMIRLHIQGKPSDLTFSGIMRFTPKSNTARVVGMGGFGLKMFDLTISPHRVTIHFLHPGIARISHAADRIAFCIRRIWMGYGPNLDDIIETSDDTTRLLGTHNAVFLDHRFAHGTHISTTASGKKEAWHILFKDRNQNNNLPRTMEFFNDRDNYSLFIKLVDAKQKGPFT